MSELTDRARTLLAAATDGPWAWVDYEFRTAEGDERIGYTYNLDDANMVAAAPSLLAELCDQLEKAEAAIARVREVHQVMPEDAGCSCGLGYPCETLIALDGE